jgi:hypothetical protein
MCETTRIRFGNFTIAFRCERSEIIDFLNLHFNSHLSEALPAFTIDIKVVPGDKAAVLYTIQRYTHTIENKKFNFGPNLVTGSWDTDRRQCTITVCDFLLTHEGVWLFDRFLCRIFYSLALDGGQTSTQTIIVHSAGIIRNNRGYIFFGPPGSGKSTITNLSRKFTVLHDDMNILSLHDSSVSVEGTPFNPKLIERTDCRGTLSMICSLHQSLEVKIERGTVGDCVQKIVSETFLPIPLLSENRKHAFEYMLHCVKKLAIMVPYYRLYFKKDDSFWNVIDNAEGIS